jgi:hypothetical protein
MLVLTRSIDVASHDFFPQKAAADSASKQADSCLASAGFQQRRFGEKHVSETHASAGSLMMGERGMGC